MTIPGIVIPYIIDALRCQAYDISGQSQAPDLITREETAQWKIADRLQQMLDDVAGDWKLE